jgi:hypothetical protein
MWLDSALLFRPHIEREMERHFQSRMDPTCPLPRTWEAAAASRTRVTGSPARCLQSYSLSKCFVTESLAGRSFRRRIPNSDE